MNHGDLRKTQNERSAMEHSTDMKNEQLKTRSVEHVEYCSCCGEELTLIEVLESYLDQHIEGALEVCGALSAEYGSTVQFELLGKIAGSLVQAATLTEAARVTTEGE
jgi:hypothetical protein